MTNSHNDRIVFVPGCLLCSVYMAKKNDSRELWRYNLLRYLNENDYSDEGTLLGHLFIGAEMIGERARNIEGFPENLLKELQHCILSHHGDPQYGAVKQPMIIEAVALSFADDTDAKLRRFSDMVGSMENTWTDKQDFAFGSKLRKTLL